MRIGGGVTKTEGQRGRAYGEPRVRKEYIKTSSRRYGDARTITSGPGVFVRYNKPIDTSDEVTVWSPYYIIQGGPIATRPGPNPHILFGHRLWNSERAKKLNRSNRIKTKLNKAVIISLYIMKNPRMRSFAFCILLSAWFYPKRHDLNFNVILLLCWRRAAAPPLVKKKKKIIPMMMTTTTVLITLRPLLLNVSF